MTQAADVLPAIRVRQWLAEWEKVPYSVRHRRRQPEPYFYLFAMNARDLRRLTGIYRRSARDLQPRAKDLGIQRRHEPKRSQEIAEFIRFGYPWSELSSAERADSENAPLRKPGWLATAVVVNVLRVGESREGRRLGASEALRIRDRGPCGAEVVLPSRLAEESWQPSLPPLEVIDGQHRLWAFESGERAGYELPVVAFRGLDRSWQAYLFWVINIKPKRINPSLAFDLYPLLRTEDWLDRAAGHAVYRETRAQELVEALWSYPGSPWFQRINMLGERGLGLPVSQAAWVHALTATFIKTWGGRGVQIGGLFGGRVGDEKSALAWDRTQQAAFLIRVWKHVADAVHASDAPWARGLRAAAKKDAQTAPFAGPYTFLSTDQGVRAVLATANDLCFLARSRLDLDEWSYAIDESVGSAIDQRALDAALSTLDGTRVDKFLKQLGTALAAYDWRRPTTPGLSERDVLAKSAFRGSGGYRLLRLQVLQMLSRRRGLLGTTAKRAAGTLR